LTIGAIYAVAASERSPLKSRTEKKRSPSFRMTGSLLNLYTDPLLHVSEQLALIGGEVAVASMIDFAFTGVGWHFAQCAHGV